MGVKKSWGEEQVRVKKNAGEKKKTFYISTFMILNAHGTMVMLICSIDTRVRILLEVKVIYDLGVHVGALG